jgi:hypothetical protein
MVRSQASPEVVRRALWEPADTAAHIKIAEKTLTQWRWQRIGPPWLKLAGGRIRYRPEDVEQWLNEQAQDGAGGTAA